MISKEWFTNYVVVLNIDVPVISAASLAIHYNECAPLVQRLHLALSILMVSYGR